MKKRPRLIYKSEAQDCHRLVCPTIEDAINLFRAEANALLQNEILGGRVEIELSIARFSDDEVAAIQEV